MKKKVLSFILPPVALAAALAVAWVYLAEVYTVNIFFEKRSNIEIAAEDKTSIRVAVYGKNIDVFEVTEKFPSTKKAIIEKYEEIDEHLNNEFLGFERTEPFTVSFSGSIPKKVTVYYSSLSPESSKWYILKEYKKSARLSHKNEIVFDGILYPPGRKSAISNMSLPNIENGYRVVVKYSGGRKEEFAFTRKVTPPSPGEKW